MSIRYVVRPASALFIVVLAAFVAGCGGSSSSGGGNASNQDAKTAYSPPPKSGCGSFTPAPLKDPDGVLKDLPAEQQAGIKSFSTGNDLYRSAWSNFKSKSDSGWKVGLSFGPLNNPGQVVLYNAIKKRLQDDPRVSKVYASSTATGVDVPKQLQDMNTMINRGVDLIVVEPLVPESFVDVVNRAAAKDIPTVTVFGTVSSPNAISVGYNSYLAAAESMSTVVRLNKGAGNNIIVHGIPATGTDLDAIRAYKDVLSRCPKAKAIGDVYGTYLNASAKRETLKFLGTHPQRIDGVMNAGVMAPGIIGAFVQAGRPVPTVIDTGNLKGSLGFWRNNKDSYNGAGSGIGDQSTMGAATAEAGLRTLAGEGPIANAILKNPPQITPSNLNEWSDPSWTLDTPGGAPGPDVPFFAPAYFDGFFKNPSNK